VSSPWVPLINQPSFNVRTMLLLLDGTVQAHHSGSKSWWLLTPDVKGSYINGTWSSRAPMHHTRLYYGIRTRVTALRVQPCRSCRGSGSIGNGGSAVAPPHVKVQPK
jgi:hypothetical protein